MTKGTLALGTILLTMVIMGIPFTTTRRGGTGNCIRGILPLTLTFLDIGLTIEPSLFTTFLDGIKVRTFICGYATTFGVTRVRGTILHADVSIAFIGCVILAIALTLGQCWIGTALTTINIPSNLGHATFPELVIGGLGDVVGLATRLDTGCRLGITILDTRFNIMIIHGIPTLGLRHTRVRNSHTKRLIVPTKFARAALRSIVI
jgi:hypothetical protein